MFLNFLVQSLLRPPCLDLCAVHHHLHHRYRHLLNFPAIFLHRHRCKEILAEMRDASGSEVCYNSLAGHCLVQLWIREHQIHLLLHCFLSTVHTKNLSDTSRQQQVVHLAGSFSLVHPRHPHHLTSTISIAQVEINPCSIAQADNKLSCCQLLAVLLH